MTAPRQQEALKRKQQQQQWTPWKAVEGAVEAKREADEQARWEELLRQRKDWRDRVQRASGGRSGRTQG